MALKNYYELLEIPPESPADEVKKAFRAQIARYHPDKVHHLGKEFQSMAADRAAELTEAHRIRVGRGRRAETTARSPKRRRAAPAPPPQPARIRRALPSSRRREGPDPGAGRAHAALARSSSKSAPRAPSSCERRL